MFVTSPFNFVSNMNKPLRPRVIIITRHLPKIVTILYYFFVIYIPNMSSLSDLTDIMELTKIGVSSGTLLVKNSFLQPNSRDKYIVIYENVILWKTNKNCFFTNIRKNLV